MITSISIKRAICVFTLIAMAFIAGYPACFIASHGLDPLGWPRVPGMPAAWFSPPGVTLGSRIFGFAITATETYSKMLSGSSDAFTGGGREAILILAGSTCFAATLLALGGSPTPVRHAIARYGDARWATNRDMGRMTRGLEIGLHHRTGSTVRAQVEGNLVTIAPPRSGKTSGLILPNLILPELGAWAGPVVVLDPKGDVVRAVRRRREALGRKVRVLDPAGIIDGQDRWNPLLNRDPNDALYLQSMARALLPMTGHTTDSGAFFTDRAVAILIAALAVTIADGRFDVIAAANLVSDPDTLEARLHGRADRLAVNARSVLNADERTRSSILTTAEQAFSWATDRRLQSILSGHTFELSQLAAGDTDLFVVLPADDRREILAPYTRWLLSDLFAAVRKNRVSERIVVMIDEASVLGRFDAILRGMAELPGYGISLWTFWQTRSQMIDVYGESGAKTIMSTAEVVICFNLSGADGEEREHWSKAIGTYTGIDPRPGRKPGEIEPQPVAVPLVPAADLARVTRDASIVFMNSRRYTTDPLRLRKTAADDRRFRNLLDSTAPIGPTQA